MTNSFKKQFLFRLKATATAGIYYKQFEELIDDIISLGIYKKNYMIFCIPILKDACEEIGSFFNIEVRLSEMLQENALMVVVKNNFLK